jgi:light-regulated signal transduction histidine kinase (bacteriophytochrome)
MRERGHYTPYEKSYVRPDGTRIPVLIGAAVLTYEPELTWISFVADLKAQKTVELELLSANKRLLDSNEGLQSFAYVAAHDLKSPMRTISTMTSILLQRYEEHLDPDTRSMADYIESSVKQMDALISDLLDYSQVAAAKQQPNETIDCAEVFNATVKNLQSQIEEAGALVSAGPLPCVQADNQLLRVFQNLIENSLKYRSERSLEIHVSAVHCGHEWIFSFRDNGIGFDPAHADRIFGVFQRLHGIGKYQGSGIGLAICKKTIDRYGGRMWAESEPGVGSTFYFSVPSNDSAVKPAG